MMAEDTPKSKTAANDLQRQVRYLRSIACLVKDAEKHDELQQEAQGLLEKAAIVIGCSTANRSIESPLR
jgi:hypothetical protein